MAAVVVVVVVILVATGGEQQTGPGAWQQRIQLRPSRKSKNSSAGSRRTRTVLGNPNAPVTLQYFGDLECPICKEFTLGALPVDRPAVGAQRAS